MGFETAQCVIVYNTATEQIRKDAIFMSSSYLEELFGLTGQTAVVIGGAGVLGGAFCAGLAGARRLSLPI